MTSYQWAGDLVYRMVGENPPLGARGAASRNGAEAALTGLDRLWARAERQTYGWKSINIRLPSDADAPAVYTIDHGDGGQPHKRAQLMPDRKTGEVTRWEPFSSYTTVRKLLSLLLFVHTGEVAGVAGQTTAGLASL